MVLLKGITTTPDPLGTCGARSPPRQCVVFRLFSNATAAAGGAGVVRTGIVLEDMPHGDLRAFLRNTDKELSWQLRLKIASDVAEGLLHMHEHFGVYARRRGERERE